MSDAKSLFEALQGDWEGPTQSWFEPGKPPEESRWRGSIRPRLNGNVLEHTYEGTAMGKPHQGVALYAHDAERELFQCTWFDTFHMGANLMHSEGPATERGFSVLGSFGDGKGGPRWGWRTEVALEGPDALRITAYVIEPGGEEAKGVETRYTRRKA